MKTKLIRYIMDFSKKNTIIIVCCYFLFPFQDAHSFFYRWFSDPVQNACPDSFKETKNPKTIDNQVALLQCHENLLPGPLTSHVENLAKIVKKNGNNILDIVFAVEASNKIINNLPNERAKLDALEEINIYGTNNGHKTFAQNMEALASLEMGIKARELGQPKGDSYGPESFANRKLADYRKRIIEPLLEQKAALLNSNKYLNHKGIREWVDDQVEERLDPYIKAKSLFYKPGTDFDRKYKSNWAFRTDKFGEPIGSQTREVRDKMQKEEGGFFTTNTSHRGEKLLQLAAKHDVPLYALAADDNKFTMPTEPVFQVQQLMKNSIDDARKAVDKLETRHKDVVARSKNVLENLDKNGERYNYTRTVPTRNNRQTRKFSSSGSVQEFRDSLYQTVAGSKTRTRIADYYMSVDTDRLKKDPEYKKFVCRLKAENKTNDKQAFAATIAFDVGTLFVPGGAWLIGAKLASRARGALAAKNAVQATKLAERGLKLEKNIALVAQAAAFGIDIKNLKDQINYCDEMLNSNLVDITSKMSKENVKDTEKLYKDCQEVVDFFWTAAALTAAGGSASLGFFRGTATERFKTVFAEIDDFKTVANAKFTDELESALPALSQATQATGRATKATQRGDHQTSQLAQDSLKFEDDYKFFSNAKKVEDAIPDNFNKELEALGYSPVQLDIIKNQLLKLGKNLGGKDAALGARKLDVFLEQFNLMKNNGIKKKFLDELVKTPQQGRKNMTALVDDALLAYRRCEK
jgi:hypothetical protein